MKLKTLLLTILLMGTSSLATAEMDKSGEGLELPADAASPLPATPPTANQKKAEDIIKSMDKSRSYDNALLEAVMYNKNSHSSRSQKMRMYSRGDVDTMVEMTDGESKGQKILRTETEVYMYMPDLDKQIRLSGASLRQSFAGSDISYEDITSIKKTLKYYNVYYLGESKAFGYKTWVLYLEEKKDEKGKTTQAYPIQKLWIDQISRLAVRGEYYSPTKKLLKETNIIKYEQKEGFSIPTEMVIQDKLKKKTSTRMLFTKIELHANISDKTFSLENLTF